MSEQIIEKIIKSRISGRCILILSDGSSLKALIDSVLKRNLNKGKFISESDIKFIENELNISGIKNYALRLCEGFSRSEFQIRTKLKLKNYDKESINSTIFGLKEIGLIDDKKFAENFIRYALNKKWGIRKITQELNIRKVSKENYLELLNQIDNPDNDFENALILAHKKMKMLSKKEPQKQKDSLTRHLISKGYSFDTIKKVVQAIL